MFSQSPTMRIGCGETRDLKKVWTKPKRSWETRQISSHSTKILRDVCRKKFHECKFQYGKHSLGSAVSTCVQWTSRSVRQVEETGLSCYLINSRKHMVGEQGCVTFVSDLQLPPPIAYKSAQWMWLGQVPGWTRITAPGNGYGWLRKWGLGVQQRSQRENDFVN